MPGRMSIRSRLTPTCPVATALAALCLVFDPRGRIAINPDLDPLRPDWRSRLRAGKSLTTSLVADENNRIVGHIAFSPVLIDRGSIGRPQAGTA